MIYEKNLSRKVFYFVPRSILRLSPPVCRVKWKDKSRLNKCPNTERADFLIAFWATVAKTAFLISWKIVAPNLADPSIKRIK